MLLLLALCFGGGAAKAHEVRPAYLEIEEKGPGRYQILWTQPVVGDRALRLVPHLSSGWLERRPAFLAANSDQLTRQWNIVDTRHPLQNLRISVEGLELSITDVLVRVSRRDGSDFTTILRPLSADAVIDFKSTPHLKLPAYFTLGFNHILGGIDHLCFVFGLLLLLGVNYRLIKAITAFTVAHSITLAASALGFVQVPPKPVEALIALSILFLAVEIARPENTRGGIAQRSPWLVAFTFGLLHGLAFAGALAETGLPQDAIPQALLLFNLGVEAGQIAFVLVAVAVGKVVWLIFHRAGETDFLKARIAAQYALGSFAAYWLIERAMLVFV